MLSHNKSNNESKNRNDSESKHDFLQKHRSEIGQTGVQIPTSIAIIFLRIVQTEQIPRLKTCQTTRLCNAPRPNRVQHELECNTLACNKTILNLSLIGPEPCQSEIQYTPMQHTHICTIHGFRGNDAGCTHTWCGHAQHNKKENKTPLHHHCTHTPITRRCTHTWFGHAKHTTILKSTNMRPLEYHTLYIQMACTTWKSVKHGNTMAGVYVSACCADTHTLSPML